MDIFSLLSYINKVSLLAFFVTTLVVGYQIYVLKKEKTKEQTPSIPDFKDMGKFIGLGISVLALAKMAGAEVETDPTSSDFGKIKVGNSRWDIWGGFQQWVRVFSQMALKARKTQKGEIVELSRKKFPFETRFDVGLRFFRGKLAPVPSLALELFEGSKLFGEEIKPTQEVIENTIPLYLQDIGEAFEQLGPSTMISVGVPAFFGVGVQTYEEKKKEGRFNF